MWKTEGLTCHSLCLRGLISLGMTFDAKTNPSVRLYQTAQRQYFHSDSCDIVALLCLQVAEKGGESMLTSVGQVRDDRRNRTRTAT